MTARDELTAIDVSTVSESEAILGLVRRALEIIESAGAYEALPAGARKIFADLFFPPIATGHAVEAVRLIVEERDNTNDAFNRLYELYNNELRS